MSWKRDNDFVLFAIAFYALASFVSSWSRSEGISLQCKSTIILITSVSRTRCQRHLKDVFALLRAEERWNGWPHSAFLSANYLAFSAPFSDLGRIQVRRSPGPGGPFLRCRWAHPRAFRGCPRGVPRSPRGVPRSPWGRFLSAFRSPGATCCSWGRTPFGANVIVGDASCSNARQKAALSPILKSSHKNAKYVARKDREGKKSEEGGILFSSNDRKSPFSLSLL